MQEEAKIAKGSVVSLDFIVKDESGRELESSVGDDPLVYLHGHGQLLPGLEKALEGKPVGFSALIEVPPADGFGERDPERVIVEKRDRFDFQPEVGHVLRAEMPDGRLSQLIVVAATEDEVTLDGNHPLAGRTLAFDVTVTDIREATPDELEHGHAHGPGPHHHG